MVKNRTLICTSDHSLLVAAGDKDEDEDEGDDEVGVDGDDKGENESESEVEDNSCPNQQYYLVSTSVASDYSCSLKYCCIAAT
jgi:hypothetical protein